MKQEELEMATRYQYIQTTRYEGIPAYVQQLYPSVVLASNDYYIETGYNDRLDLIANDFYGDSTLWWAISSANYGSRQNSYYPPIGVQLRIPSNIQGLILNFEKENA